MPRCVPAPLFAHVCRLKSNLVILCWRTSPHSKWIGLDVTWERVALNSNANLILRYWQNKQPLVRFHCQRCHGERRHSLSNHSEEAAESAGSRHPEPPAVRLPGRLRRSLPATAGQHQRSCADTHTTHFTTRCFHFTYNFPSLFDFFFFFVVWNLSRQEPGRKDVLQWSRHVCHEDPTGEQPWRQIHT